MSLTAPLSLSAVPHNTHCHHPQSLSPKCVTLSLTVSPRHSPRGPQSPSASEGAWSSPQGRHCSAGSGRGPQPPAVLDGTQRQGHTGTGDEHMLTDRDTHKGTGLAMRTGIPYKFCGLEVDWKPCTSCTHRWGRRGEGTPPNMHGVTHTT